MAGQRYFVSILRFNNLTISFLILSRFQQMADGEDTQMSTNGEVQHGEDSNIVSGIHWHFVLISLLLLILLFF